MYRKTKLLLPVFASLLLILGPSAQAEWAAGRAMEEGKTVSIRFKYGAIDSIDGDVRETKRAGADEVTTEGRFLERYTFDELGLGDDYESFGLQAEKMWKYISLELDTVYAHVDSSAVARRDYAIGLESVSYRGEDYEYMLIPGGTRFDAEMDTYMIDAKMRITPAHLVLPNHAVAISPWLLLGVYGVWTDFSIDAGAPKGTTTYETDPFLYVIGGDGDGNGGAFLPSIGGGGEVRCLLFPMNGRYAEFAIQGDIAILDVVADTGDFGVSSRNEKVLDIDYTYYELRAQLELPLSEDVDLLLGASIKRVDTDAKIEAKHSEVKTTEKYDKHADITIDMYSFFAGLTF